MKRWQFYTVAALVMLTLVVAPLLSSLPSSSSLAQEKSKEAAAPAAAADAAAPSIPDGVVDPAFDRYVDIGLLLDAWQNMDAGLMTDLALQLAEGERVLMRSHKAGSAADLLKLAVKSAVSKGDKASLDRIAKAAKALGKDDISGLIASASKLGGAARSDDPALKVSVDRTNPDDFALYSNLLQSIKSAELVTDRDAIKDLRDHLSEIKGLTDQQRAYLKKVADQTLTSIPEKSEQTNSVADTLRKLSGPSRGGFNISVPGIGGYVSGGGYRGGHSGYGGHGYGHGGYGHGGYGHGGYGHGGYGHNFYGRTYGHSGYGHSGYGHSGYGHSGYGHSGYGHSGYGHNYGHSTYGRTNYYSSGNYGGNSNFYRVVFY